MEFENVTLATESITLFTTTGLHTFENLIDLNTLNLEKYDQLRITAEWEVYLNIICGLTNDEVESFINDHGHVIPQDWLERHAAFDLIK
ncbi:MAG: hypothetical protein J5965_23315 [Aeriscardovia sp.]|nr:hypothetical protein [Aeriscardovia sp.]